MASTLKIVAGNTAPSWLITCERAGVPIDLAGCSATVNISDGDVLTRTGGVCTIVDSPNGIISYTPTSSDCPEATTYVVDVKIVYGGGPFEVLYEQLKVKTRDALIPPA